jgi:trimeric autotransporter adhesin
MKKLIVTAFLLFSFPALAQAASWTLTTQVKSSGGSMTSRNLANQTSSSGSLFKSYTTHAPQSVSVTATTGYSIGNVTVNGVVTSAPASPFSASVQGMTAQSVVATFTPTPLSVTASASAGGSVSPTSVSNILYGSKLTSPLVFSFRPAAGFHLSALSGATGATVSSALPAAINTVVTARFPTGYTFTAPIALSGSFESAYPVAEAGNPQTVLTGSQVTLTASYSGGSGTPPASYTWLQTGGPASLTLASTGNLASFTPSFPGIYQFKVTLDTGSSATTSVTVTSSLPVAARSQCQNCHSNTGIGTAQLFSNWSSSRHKSAQLMCYACHVGANTGGHPGSIVKGSVQQTTFNFTSGANFCVTCHTPSIVSAFNGSPHASHSVTCSSCHTGGAHNPDFTASACDGCHRDGTGSVPGHPLAIGNYACITCHDPHTTVGTGTSGDFTPAHFNNLTGAGYPASYLTSRAGCANCHNPSAENTAIRYQWGASGHAATTEPPWRAYDFKTMSGCAQCHTTTGFIAYSTGKVTAAWGLASDKTKEVLTCVGCHSNIATGALRPVKAVRPFADDSYRNREVGSSNLCMNCHSGRNNGNSIQIKVGSANFGNLPFIAPHYLAAAATLHGTGGFHFPGQAYAFYSSNSHRAIGMGNKAGTGDSGPCVGCHMSAPDKHLYLAVAVDANRTITAITSPACANCHAASLEVAQLNAEKLAFANALKVLKAMLADRGFVYSSSYPYFSATNWGADQTGANAMGAAFNYVLLLSETGAYAHNGAYAKKLIADSIDCLYNGSVTGSIDSALSHLETTGAITPAEAQSLAGYRTASSCTSCHANTSGSHPAHLNSGFDCARCHSTTAASSTALVPGTQSHLNNQFDLAAGLGSSFNYSYAPSGGTCSAISCHNNGTAVWGGSLGCDGCHDAPPATASHLKHYGGSVAQAGYGNTGIAGDLSANSGAYVMNCGNCHPMDGSKHGNGVVDVELYNPLAPAGSLKALNPASAAYLPGSTVLADSRGLNYTLGTCSNVYCHSFTTTTTTSLVPDGDPNWQAKVVKTRIYKTATWGSAPLNCAGCHGNPTQTSYPANDGGAGDSHSWIDSEGYQNLHTYNMGASAPISCRFCHNDTVKQLNTFTADIKGNWTLSNVPISNYSKHVNGRNDVAFDKQNSFTYYTYYGGGPVYMSLANATYDPATKNCGNVSCHFNETVVKWGTPYRYYYNECDRCHGYGGI